MEAAAEAVTARIEQERHTDGARIQHHIESSRAQVELLVQAEAELIAYVGTFTNNLIQGVQATFARLREDEHRRLAELQAHAEDINTEEAPEMIEQQPHHHRVKRLKAVN